MRVLIACEESQRVCISFRERGHEAYSCDIMDCSGEHPEWHIKQDVLPLINGNCVFKTLDGHTHSIQGKWDLLIAHPPCTYLTVTGNRWFNVERYGDKAIQRAKDREYAVAFFMAFANADCEHICIENPVGCMSTRWRKPDCIYNPYDFEGETECKKTCLWLKGLTPLKGTRAKPLPKEQRTRGIFQGCFDGKSISWNSPECSKMRSKTPYGVATAMAEQWG